MTERIDLLITLDMQETTNSQLEFKIDLLHTHSCELLELTYLPKVFNTQVLTLHPAVSESIFSTEFR